MIRAFVDASVLFAACYSETGASREILRYASRDEVTLIISDVVIEEARRNLGKKAPRAMPSLDQLLESTPFDIVEATHEQVLRAYEYTELKDAPIVAAAIRAGAAYLISLDREHLVGVPEVAMHSGIIIVLPGSFLQIIKDNPN